MAPSPSPLPVATFKGPPARSPAPGFETVWPNTLAGCTEVWEGLEGSTCIGLLASTVATVLGDVDEVMREAVGSAAPAEPAAAIRFALVCRCRLLLALATKPDSADKIDPNGVEELLVEVDHSRAALRDLLKADPGAPALLTVDRQLSDTAREFARVVARAGRGKAPAARQAPARAVEVTPQQRSPPRIRLLAGLGVLAAGILGSIFVQLWGGPPPPPPPPRVLFAPKGAISLVGERSGVSLVDLGKNASPEQIAAFKAAAAANGKEVREISPGQFIFLGGAPDAGPAVDVVDAGELADAATPGPAEGAP